MTTAAPVEQGAPRPAPPPPSPSETDDRPSGPDGSSQPTETPTDDTSGLARLRVVAVMVIVALLGGFAGAVFDSRLWVIAILPLLPGLVVASLLSRRFVVRAAATVVAIPLTVTVLVVIEGGSSSDVLAAFTSGPQRLLSTDWPSPRRPDLVATVAAALATAAAVSAELATRRRWHLLPLLPLVLFWVAAVGLSAPAGTAFGWLLAIGLVAATFAALHQEGALADRLLLLRGERRLIPLLAIAVGLTAAIAVPLQMDDRADPRQNDPAERAAPLVDPIESTLALQDLDPPQVLHTVEGPPGERLPMHWRTAALDRYEGQRWSPSLTLRPIGRTLGDATGPVIDVDVQFLDDDLALLPLPGSPVTVDIAVETDPERTIVRLTERPTPGLVASVTANRPPTRADAAERGIAPREVDDEVSGLTELADALGGQGTLLERLAQIESTMREEFVLDSNVQGGGLQRALVERFLRDTRRGSAEQFATSYVLLARSLGADARVATGFIVDPGSDGELELASGDARVWPEVRLVGGGWLALDPVPEEDVSDLAPTPDEPQVQSPAAPQPPIEPPPDPTTENDDTDEPAATTDESALSTVVRAVLRILLPTSILLLPLAAVAALILGAKYRRRRRRLRTEASADRIRGAWATATDALVDAGMTIPPSWTDAEIAGAAAPLVSTGKRELRRLAALSTAATYGYPSRVAQLADDATKCLHTVEGSMASQRTWWQRWRWRLSLRSLRSTTRSPVR